MAFAVVGAHRTGKTTLAKAAAEKMGWNYLDASISAIMKAHGIDGVAQMSPVERIDAQEFLLAKFCENILAAPRPFITDRSPLDMIMYSLGEVTMHNISAELGARYDRYAEKCLDATVNHFDSLFVVRPFGGAYIPDPKSPPPNLAYQRECQYILEGAAFSVCRRVEVNWLFETGLDDRVQTLCEGLHMRMGELLQIKQAAGVH